MTYDAFVDEEASTMWTSHEDYSDLTEVVTDDDIEYLCTH